MEDPLSGTGREDLEKAALRLAAALGDAGVVVGGLALAAWGYVRATDDVDFVSTLPAREVADRLRRAGIVCSIERGDTTVPWCVRGVVEGIRFDVLPPVVPLALSSAILVPTGDESLRVVDLDGLIRLKLRAGGPQDLLDVAQLLRRHPEAVGPARADAAAHGVWAQVERWMKDPRLR